MVLRKLKVVVVEQDFLRGCSIENLWPIILNLSEVVVAKIMILGLSLGSLTPVLLDSYNKLSLELVQNIQNTIHALFV